MKRRLLTMALTLACAAAAHPLTAAESGELRRTLDILKRANAPLERTILDNGMVCLLKEDHAAPVVSIQIWVGTGSIDEEEHLGSGLSHAIEHMIFKGTPTRAPGDITREIHDAGGSINAYTSLDRTVFHTDLPSRNWRVGLDVLADAVMHASFPAEEWQKEKHVILREISMGYDDPARVLNKLLWGTAYRVHPYRVPVIGYEELVRNVTREDLESFARRNYLPDNMIVIVVGDIDAGEVRAAIDSLFTDFERQARAPIVVPPEPPQPAPRFVRVTGAYQVSRLQCAFHTVSLGHEDAAALDVLAQIVGRGRSSRLGLDLKERRQLVYSVDAWSYTPLQPGLFGITASFAPAKEPDVIQALNDQVAAWKSGDFTDEEIAKARRNLLVSELSDLETVKGQANSYASGEFYTGSPTYGETYVQQVGAVDAATLKRVAGTYLRPENRTIVVLAPEDRSAAAPPVSVVPPPATKRVELPNGIPLVAREDHRLPFAYFCVTLKGGLLSEHDADAGISRLMAELLVRGTASRSSEQIAETVESLGGRLTAFSGYNSFGLQARCLTQDAPLFMELIADCILHPTFPEDEVAKQKALQLAAIAREAEQPFALARRSLRALVFTGHPYRWNPLGEEKTVADIDREAVQAHYRSLLAPDNIVMAVFGDIDAESALRLARNGLSQVPRTEAVFPSRQAATPELPARHVRREPKNQAIVLAGFPGIDVTDPRADALRVLKTALSGLSSSLATEIREDRGLAYYMGAYEQVGLDPGIFTLYAGTRPEAVEEIESIFRREVARLTTQGLTEEEFIRARNRVVADFEESLQHNQAVAMDCALNELYGLGYQHALDTKERIEALTREQVRQAAASILSTNRMAISIVLPETHD